MKKHITTNTPIKSMGKVITGKTPPTKDKDNYGEGYMFITPNELHGEYLITDSEKHITSKGLQEINTNSISGTSVLVGCIGWDMGNVAMCFEKCATNQQINSITHIKPEYDPYFIYYWLSGKKDYLFSIASVTRTPILSKSTFEDVIIPMPSIELQKKVSSVLLALDNKIVTNNKINDNLAA